MSAPRPAPRPALRRRLPLLLAAGLMLPLLAACSGEEKKAEIVIRPVKVVEVSQTDQDETLVFSGSVKARTDMNLGFRIAGKITERHVDIGDRVKPGDILMRLDATDINLAVQRAEADLSAARQQFETTEAAYERARQLFDQKTIAKAQLEGRELSFQQAKSQLASAQSALEQTRNQIGYANLTADKAGVITAVNADIGQVIGAGSVLVGLAVDGEREVQIAVPEMDIAQIKTGQTVTAGFWSDKTIALKGEIREIAASADPVSRTFAVRVRLPDDPRVLIGMTATIETRIAKAQSGYTLPIAAIGQSGGKPVVWLVDKTSQTVSSRPVTVSGYSADGVFIGGGLKPGDLVVAAGTQFMTEKLKVRLDEAQTGGLSAPVPQG